MIAFPRLNANDSSPAVVVYISTEELIKKGYYPVITADSTEFFWRKSKNIADAN